MTDLFTYLSCTSSVICAVLLSLASGICAGIVSARLYNGMPAVWLCEVEENVCGIHIPGMRRRSGPFLSYPVRSIRKSVSGKKHRKKRTERRNADDPVYEAFFFCASAASLLVLSALATGLPSPAECSVSVICLIALAAAAQSDILFLIIPDQISLFIAAAGLLCPLTEEDMLSGFQSTGFLSSLFSHLAGGTAGFLTMFAASLLSFLTLKREGAGMGDVKLIGACGTFLGIETVFFLIFLASLLCCIPAACRRFPEKAKRENALPMAPAILAAFTLCLMLRTSF